MKLAVVLGAGAGYSLFESRAKAAFWKELSPRRAESLFPALTCPVQATLRTAALPSEHGMIASGYFDRALQEPFFWKQPSTLYGAPRIWESFRKRGGKVAQVCFQQCAGTDSDVFLSPAPIHKHHGGMIQEFLSRPPDLYHEICEVANLSFNLMHYWGPFASIKSSAWITEAGIEVIRRLAAERESLILIYLPHLDYAQQKHGPRSARTAKAFAEFEQMVEALLTCARENGYEFTFCGDYEITEVDTPVYPNRILRNSSYFDVRHVGKMTYPQYVTSRAFALADHQIAHVYVREKEDLDALKMLFGMSNGIGRVLERDHTPELNHPRAGELILEAAEGYHFSYQWWDRPEEAPDYADHVDIHNKPGFDPCELFPLAWWNPFRTSMDASCVRGSHGRAGNGVVLASTFALPESCAAFPDYALHLKQMLEGS